MPALGVGSGLLPGAVLNTPFLNPRCPVEVLAAPGVPPDPPTRTLCPLHPVRLALQGAQLNRGCGLVGAGEAGRVKGALKEDPGTRGSPRASWRGWERLGLENITCSFKGLEWAARARRQGWGAHGEVSRGRGGGHSGSWCGKDEGAGSLARAAGLVHCHSP